MTENRRQERIDKLIGRVGDAGTGEYYLADYAFDHALDRVTQDTATALKAKAKPFRGVTGTVLRLISKAEYEERTDPENIAEYLGDVWRESVAAGSTDLGLTEWAAEAYRHDGDDLIFDLSSYSEGEELIKYLARIDEIDPEEYCDFCECIGGGRIFGHSHKAVVGRTGESIFDYIYEPELWIRIMKVENENASWFDDCAEVRKEA